MLTKIKKKLIVLMMAAMLASSFAMPAVAQPAPVISNAAAAAKTIKAGTVTFKDNKNGYDPDTGATRFKKTYYKFKAPKTGTVTLAWKSGDGGRIGLCNSKKKLISIGQSKISYQKYKYNDNFNPASNQVTYGIKKGITYYFVWEGYEVTAKLSVTAVKDKSGNTMKKAKAMSLGKSYKGLIIAGEKASKKDWYKITLKKGEYSLCAFNKTAANAGFIVKVYDKDGNMISIDSGYGIFNGESNKLKDNRRISMYFPYKTTYYISVQKDNNAAYSPDKASGSYVLGIIKN